MGSIGDWLDLIWSSGHKQLYGVILRAALDNPMHWKDIKPIFNENLDRLLKEKGWSRRKLSLKITSNEFYISKLINGDGSLGFDKVLDISQALGIHYSELFESELSRVSRPSPIDDDAMFEDLVISVRRYTNATAMIRNREIGPRDIINVWKQKEGEINRLVDILDFVDIYSFIPEYPFLQLDRMGEQSLSSQVLNGPKRDEYEKELEGPLAEKLAAASARYKSVIETDDIIFTDEVIRTDLLSDRSLVLKYECYLLPGRIDGKPEKVLTFADPNEVKLVKKRGDEREGTG